MFRGFLNLTAVVAVLVGLVVTVATLTVNGWLMLSVAGVTVIILDGLWDRAQAEREAVRRA
jgi:hypothetical protein